MSNIDGILLKLERAYEHLNIFNKEVERFLKSKPCGHISERKYKRGSKYEVIVRIVYQLTFSNGGIDRQLESCEFPIFDTYDAFHAVRKNGTFSPSSGLYKIRGVNTTVQTIIKSLQPYHSGANATIHPLWILHQLCNVDKHRRLCLTQCPIGSIELVDICRPLIDGTEILRFRILAPSNFQGKVTVRQKVPPHIAFEETITLPDMCVGEILQNILIFVNNDVILQFEPLLK